MTSYTRNPTWLDMPNLTTPILAAKLENMETGIETAHTGKADKGTLFIDAYDHGVRGDAVQVFDAAMTSGSAVLTSATGAFTAANSIGKTAWIKGAGVSGAVLKSTIATWQSATQVTLAANASTTVSAKQADWGTDNTALLQAAHLAAAVWSNTERPIELLLRPGTYLASGLKMAQANNAVMGSCRWRGTGPAGALFLAGRPYPVRILRPLDKTDEILFINCFGPEMENITLDGNGTAGRGIDSTFSMEMRLSHCHIVNCPDGSRINGAQNAYLEFLSISNCGKADGTAAALFVGGVEAVGPPTTSQSIRIDFVALKIEWCPGPLLDLAYNVSGNSCRHVHLTNPHFEAPALEAPTSWPMVRVGAAHDTRIIGGHFYTGAAGALLYDEQFPIANQWGSVFLLGTKIEGDLALAPDRAFDLVRGQDFGLHSCSVANFKNEVIRAASTFGNSVMWSNLHTEANHWVPTTVFTDARADQGGFARPSWVSTGGVGILNRSAKPWVTGLGTAGGITFAGTAQTTGGGIFDFVNNGTSNVSTFKVDTALNRIGVFGATPVAKQGNPGTATGTDATVVNNIVTALRNYGLVV